MRSKAAYFSLATRANVKLKNEYSCVLGCDAIQSGRWLRNRLRQYSLFAPLLPSRWWQSVLRSFDGYPPNCMESRLFIYRYENLKSDFCVLDGGSYHAGSPTSSHFTKQRRQYNVCSNKHSHSKHLNVCYFNTSTVQFYYL